MDFPYMFICHSHLKNDVKFNAFIKELKRGLSKRGIDCFIDHENLKGGDIWHEKLLKELEKTDGIIVVANKELVRSTYCGLERGFAYARQIPELILVHSKEVKSLPSFISTQKVEELEFSEAWWNHIEDFAKEKHEARKKSTHVEEVNAIISAAPHLSGVQLNILLATIINPISSILQPGYFSGAISIQTETQSSMTVTATQQIVSGGVHNE